MKKILFSAAVSLLLLGTLTAIASAATNSLIGKKVQSAIEFTVNGKPVKDAVIIDGTTYVPARSFSEAAGYSIAIEGGTVKMIGTETQVEDASDTEAVTETRSEDDITTELRTKHEIRTLQNNISTWQIMIDGNSETAKQAQDAINKAEEWNATKGDDVIKMSTKGAEDKLAKAQAEIAELQAKIDAAEEEIKLLEAQLKE